MATIHDEIDNWLVADIHGELSEQERSALHTHLVECGGCRKTHQETKAMNKILEETFTAEKPGPGFEQRMLADFRSRLPEKPGLVQLLTQVMRVRAVQITSVGAVLLGLVQIGRMITGENATAVRDREAYRKDKFIASPSEMAASHPAQAGALSKSDELATRSQDFALAKPQAPPAPPTTQSEFRDASSERAKTLAARKASAANTENFARAEEAQAKPGETPVPELANRKLIRNARVELEIVSFNNAIQKISAFANEERGYVATTDSQKQANGKLRGQVVVKVLPENLDRLLQKLRTLGELKNQTLGTEDVTKAYLDTDARLKNARVMEQRLIDMLKTKTGKVSDLLQVEKELARVREEIEKMQGELKYWDSQVQFATVTILLAEKDMEEPAAFLIKERAQLALYAPDVEKIYNDVKALASPKVQITNAQLNRDYSGRVSATMSMLIAPEESESVISRVKGLGRVENFQTQTERIAQGGSGMSENAKNVTLRVPMKNYNVLMQSLDSLGKVENVSVQRQDRAGAQIDEANAPADISIQVYSQGNIVSHESGLLATLRRTLAQSAGAIMWSLRMIGVAIAFLAPWVVAIVAAIWITKRVIHVRR